MRLRMLKHSVGKGRQVIKQLCRRMLHYCATERAGYVLYRALVLYINNLQYWEYVSEDEGEGERDIFTAEVIEGKRKRKPKIRNY